MMTLSLGVYLHLLKWILFEGSYLAPLFYWLVHYLPIVNHLTSTFTRTLLSVVLLGYLSFLCTWAAWRERDNSWNSDLNKDSKIPNSENLIGFCVLPNIILAHNLTILILYLLIRGKTPTQIPTNRIYSCNSEWCIVYRMQNRFLTWI